ncbi:MAG: hypothetical protein U9N46_14750, partial [Euryarchaeota archaeon]|nr:hypothetical protein [Euryarchaeota archaeon]
IQVVFSRTTESDRTRTFGIGTCRALESGSGCEIKVDMIDHPVISEILCYTHTYAGQALAGETVEARGMMEELIDHRRRLVVGTSRESVDESVEWIVNS